MTKAENKDVAAPVTGKKEEDSNIACSLEDSSKEKDDHEDAKLEDMKKLQEEICVECGKTFIEGKRIDSSKKD